MDLTPLNGFAIVIIYLTIAMCWIFAACINLIMAFFLPIPYVAKKFETFNEWFIGNFIEKKEENTSDYKF